MSTNEFVENDYLTEARDRVTEQFKNKEVFDAYIQLLIYGQQQLQSVYKDLMQKRSIETAEGEQLDIIGQIVGLERGFLPSSAWNDSYFGFLDDATALSMDDLDAPVDDAGILFDLQNALTGNVAWDDITYRLYLKSKIFANTSRGTPEDLITATKAILNVSYVDIIELGNANMIVGFDRLLSPIEKEIVRGVGEQEHLLPIPIGVGVEYLEAAQNEFFGFEDTPGALGISDLSDPDEGGFLASLF